MKAVVFTLGCKVNECESDSLISGLVDRGYEVSDKLEYADIYVVNTCAVTSEAEKKSRQTVSRIRRLNPTAKIIFTGCACQKDPKSFADKSNEYLITGVYGKNQILDMLEKSGEKIKEEVPYFEELLPVKSLRTRTYVKVEDGCNNFCSYCIIPYLRGRVRSRDPENVIKEINAVKPKEAVINGINLSAYNYNGQNLTDLIKRLWQVDCRIRLGSIEASIITEEFLTALKGLKDFAEHFHLSLQSGSDYVLKTMNRKYTCKEYLDKVELIRKYFPDAGITTDIIAGFPTEGEENFAETVKFIRQVGFSDIHPFPFSKRQGTVAYKMQDLPTVVKKDRLNELLKIKGERKSSFIQSQIGKTAEIIGEEIVGDYTEGYSGNYIRLYVKGAPLSKKTKVKIVKEYKDGAIAEII